MTTISAKQSDTMQDMLCSLSGNWWLFVLRGVLALVIAVLAAALLFAALIPARRALRVDPMLALRNE